MNQDQAVFEALLKLNASGEAAALATVVSVSGSVPRHAGSKMLVRAGGSIVGTVGGGAMEQLVITEALAAIADGQARLPAYSLNNLEAGDPGICGGTAQVFIEPVGLVWTLLVVGGGHVGRALAELGKWAGYRVLLSDDREAFCNADYAPGLDGYIVCPPDELTTHVNVGARTCVAAVTRGLPVDMALIPVLLATDAPYIGLIGSRRRWALTVRALQEERGLSAAQLARVRAPIGLEIEAETPQEIAISILAEVTMMRRGGDGQPMRQPPAGDAET